MLTCTVSVHPPVPERYTRCASIFLRSFSLNIVIRYTWTKIDRRTRFSLGHGRSPKRIGPNTRPSHGMANIVGFDPPMSCAWSNTGVDRGLRTRSVVVNQRAPNNVAFRLGRQPENNPHLSYRSLSSTTRLICSVAASLIFQRRWLAETADLAFTCSLASGSGLLIRAFDLLPERRMVRTPSTVRQQDMTRAVKAVVAAASGAEVEVAVGSMHHFVSSRATACFAGA